MGLDKKDLEQISEVIKQRIYTDISPLIDNKLYDLKSDVKIIRQKLEQIWESESEDIEATTNLIEKMAKEMKKLENRISKLENN